MITDILLFPDSKTGVTTDTSAHTQALTYMEKYLLQFAYQRKLSEDVVGLFHIPWLCYNKSYYGRIPCIHVKHKFARFRNHLDIPQKRTFQGVMSWHNDRAAYVIFLNKNDEITARESFSIIPRSPSFESINQSTRTRIIRILSKIVDIWREQWITRDHFKIQK